MTAIEMVQMSARELQRTVELHERLVAAAMEGGDFEDVIGVCPFLDCPHRKRSRGVILEAIHVLEDTRKAFKSKQLEALRKKLIGALADSS